MSAEKYMLRALELAREALAEGEVPVGCVIADDRTGEIVGEGRNRREESRRATAHAEIEAIESANARLHGWRLWFCTLYVTLEPCAMCAGAIVNARVPRVVYGAPDERFGACGSRFDLFAQGLNHTPAVEAGLLRDDCAGLMREFFASLRERNKRQGGAGK